MESVSIDFSLSNLWRSWYKFRQGKKRSREIDHFSYYLERNLFLLWQELNNDLYIPGLYRNFVVTDNKRREISVAPIRDRVVHRLFYEYLTDLYDKNFFFDVWSCRKGKGLVGAIDRTQSFLHSYPESLIWRADISKFFDNVNQDTLINILGRKVLDPKGLGVISTIIRSYQLVAHSRERERVKCRGILESPSAI